MVNVITSDAEAIAVATDLGRKFAAEIDDWDGMGQRTTGSGWRGRGWPAESPGGTARW